MEHKQAEEFFQELINNLDTVPREVNWQKERSWYVLEEKLKPVSKKKLTHYWFYAIAASVSLVISIGWFAFEYIDNQEKEIAQLKQKLYEVKVPEREPEMYVSANISDKHQLSNDAQKAVTKQKNLPIAQKKYRKNKKVQPENSLMKDVGSDSTVVISPALQPEEEITATSIAEEKLVAQPKSVQEIMLGKVKQQYMNGSRKPIIITFPGARDEHMARQAEEPLPKPERKIKLHNLIINNSRESAAEAQQHTGADSYPRLHTEKAN